ncbi:hypothetical protein BDY21DRAFT_375674 [Lineolata rhizophorae]|uniref:Uncharacterized protein n=1 Tax=Lineolata rhizophorae TaxID=578093 RepID=A0A6A6NKU9_9PEZI|nr:hypothetical protein BDY21DRAFT_375674 [Lineolata rhizophorae]
MAAFWWGLGKSGRLAWVLQVLPGKFNLEEFTKYVRKFDDTEFDKLYTAWRDTEKVLKEQTCQYKLKECQQEETEAENTLLKGRLVEMENALRFFKEEIAELCAQAQNPDAKSQSAQDPPIFDGNDKSKFNAWLSQLKYKLKNLSINDDDKLVTGPSH